MVFFYSLIVLGNESLQFHFFPHEITGNYFPFSRELFIRIQNSYFLHFDI